MLQKQITSPKQDKFIGMLIVGITAALVAYALQSATQSTIAAIDHTMNIAASMQSF